MELARSMNVWSTRGAALALASLLLAGMASSARADNPPLDIDAMLSLTGAQAFVGQSEAAVLRIVEDVVNRHGGVGGRPVRFVIADDQTNPEIGLQLANGMIARKTPLIIGPGVSASCNAITPLVAASGPVIDCLTPASHPPSGSYAFASTVPSSVTMGVGVRYFRERGWTRLALLATVDSTGGDLEASIERALLLPENRGTQLVAIEHFSPTDVSVAAQVARIKAANPQAILTATSGTPFGTILRSLSDAGMQLPVFAASGNMTQAAMTQYRAFLPTELYFTTLLGAASGTVGNGPIHDAQMAFIGALKARGLKPDSAQVVTWDPAMLAVAAYRHFGADMTAAQAHDYLEHLHGVAGINGIYDFRDGSQRGLRENAVAVFTWNAAQRAFVPVSRAGGRLR